MSEVQKTVWILGSGFSRPLGGPLLRDLFRQQSIDDLLALYPSDSYGDFADTLRWTQRFFQKGLQEGLWEHAEQFLVFVDDAYRGAMTKKDRLKNLMGRSAIERSSVGSRSIEAPSPEKIASLHSAFHKVVRRCLAAECSRFLLTADTSSELWHPYAKWRDALVPGKDTVVSFNYDRVIETIVPKGDESFFFWVPGDSVPNGNRIAVLKLHGSIDWVVEGTAEKPSVARSSDPEYPLRTPDAEIAIAAPGASKKEVITRYLDELSQAAMVAIRDARRVMLVGYSAPESDPFSQYRILEALAAGPNKRIHVVLGPEETANTQRVLALLASADPEGRARVNGGGPGGSSPHLDIRCQRLWAQDFIGRFEEFNRVVPAWHTR